MAQALALCFGADDATALLILQMQQEDLRTLSQGCKGKQREGEVDDFAFALSLYQAELEVTSTAVSDRQMAASFAQATRRDGRIIVELMAEESQAVKDRRMAFTFNEGGDISAAATPNPRAAMYNEADIEDELLARFAALNNSQYGEENDDEDIQAESSSWATSRLNASETIRSQCVACMDTFAPQTTMQVPCGDVYCHTCLVQLFTHALTDESLFPPRCHGQPIEIAPIRAFLGAKLVGQFLAKKLEFETPNRTYCHRPQCATFIPPLFVRDDVGTCAACSYRTCAICKKENHVGDCPEDPATQELMNVAREAGWKQCYNCHQMVELTTGCNHITCRCNAQFCYVCVVPWKSCTCAQWDEALLLERANEVNDRDPGERRPLLAVREQLIHDHNCQHRSWRRINGQRTCERCAAQLPAFLNVCQQCNIMVCNRCRNNRL